MSGLLGLNEAYRHAGIRYRRSRVVTRARRSRRRVWRQAVLLLIFSDPKIFAWLRPAARWNPTLRELSESRVGAISGHPAVPADDLALPLFHPLAATVADVHPLGDRQARPWGNAIVHVGERRTVAGGKSIIDHGDAVHCFRWRSRAIPVS